MAYRLSGGSKAVVSIVERRAGSQEIVFRLKSFSPVDVFDSSGRFFFDKREEYVVLFFNPVPERVEKKTAISDKLEWSLLNG